MMLENVLVAAGPGDNARGGVACPPWLFLLDRLDPGRVLYVGPPAPGERRWLTDNATELRVVSAESLLDGSTTDTLPPAHFDVVHLGPDGAAVLASDMALSRLRATASSDAQLWSSAAERDGGDRPLRRAGFERIRWIQAVTSSRSLMTVAAEADPATTQYLPPPKRRGRRARVTEALRASVGPVGNVAARAGGLVRSRPDPPRIPGIVAGGNGPHEGPPKYVADLAGAAGLDLSGYRWSLWARGAYPSQKAVMFLFGPGATAPDVVVKVTKDPRFNPRLDNEHATLAKLTAAGDTVAGRAPRPLFHGRSGGLAVVGQGAVSGRPFVGASALTADCPVAADAVTTITALGFATATAAPAATVAEPLSEVLDRFRRLFSPSPAAAAFLERQVGIIGGHDQLPAVLHHGDLGTWNLLVDDRGQVSILDWEAAEQPGPPLWDLAYFLRSYAVQISRRRIGLDRRRRGLRRHLLAVSPLTLVAGKWIERYREAIDLDRELVAPLFHTCWMHRAVKEATRLPAGRRGHYADLCLLLADRHESPGLRVLLEGNVHG